MGLSSRENGLTQHEKRLALTTLGNPFYSLSI